ncbi:MAG: glycosyltransferase [Verrucomicrobia bacterium]|nr:glycosyltransferase [Verrucomicrobiota bacterium]
MITPFHRVVPWLCEAGESLRAQTLTDWEWLVVDDGTGSGLSSLGELGRDPRIRLLSHATNCGVSAARNLAVSAARGEFLAMLDYDDVARPQRLERQVTRLRAEPALGLVGSAVDTIDEHGATVGREFALLDGVEQTRFSQYTMPVALSACTGRREVFERYAFRRDFDTAEDYDFFTRVGETWMTGAVAEPLAGYRVYASQTTQQRQDRQVFAASCVRLLTARRRAGRAEGWAELKEELGAWMAAPPKAEVAWLDFAQRCVRENFPRLAVYHARRHLMLARRPGAVVAALQVLRGALGQAKGAARREVLRVFLMGPLRAHRLGRRAGGLV